MFEEIHSHHSQKFWLWVEVRKEPFCRTMLQLQLFVLSLKAEFVAVISAGRHNADHRRAQVRVRKS